jgi:hypothetical protein
MKTFNISVQLPAGFVAHTSTTNAGVVIDVRQDEPLRPLLRPQPPRRPPPSEKQCVVADIHQIVGILRFVLGRDATKDLHRAAKALVREAQSRHAARPDGVDPVFERTRLVHAVADRRSDAPDVLFAVTRNLEIVERLATEIGAAEVLLAVERMLLEGGVQ